MRSGLIARRFTANFSSDYFDLMNHLHRVTQESAAATRR
jgi:hypothetical protein